MPSVPEADPAAISPQGPHHQRPRGKEGPQGSAGQSQGLQQGQPGICQEGVGVCDRGKANAY